MIDEKYITSFVAVHELDEITPQTSGAADIGQDDLFLMSKMVKYATESENAKMVSKKVNYQTFAGKLSSDFGLSSISKMSADISAMSSLVDEHVESLCTDICCTSSEILGTLCSTVDSLSSTVEEEYTKKHEGTLVLARKDAGASMAQIATQIGFSDGQPVAYDIQPASWLIHPDNFKCANGGIKTDAKSVSSATLASDKDSIVYEISSDCWLDIAVSAFEKAESSPIQVVLSSSDSEQPSVVIDTFNNSGGFSGTKYFSYYQTGAMVKAVDRSTQHETHLSVVLRRADGDSLLASTTAQFSEMYLYEMPAKDELSAYAIIPPNLQLGISSAALSVMKISLDKQGMIVSAEGVPYQYASEEVQGFIKLLPQDFYEDNACPVKLSSGQYAYAYVPTASDDKLGAVRSGFSHAESTESISCQIAVDADGRAAGIIPAASDSRLGVVRAGLQTNEEDLCLSAAVALDSSRNMFVKIPAATIESLGLVRTGTKVVVFPGHDELRNVFLDNNDKSRAKVNVMTEGSLQAQRFFTPIDVAASETIDISKTLVLNDDSAVEVSEDEEVCPAAGPAVKKSKLGQWKWTAEIPREQLEKSRVFAVYAMYHGHSDIEPQHGVQVIVQGKAMAAFFPSGCKTCDSGEWFDTKFIGSFSREDDDGIELEAVSGSKSFQNGSTADEITFIVRDLMK